MLNLRSSLVQDFDAEDFGGRKPTRKRRAAAPSEEDEEVSDVTQTYAAL